MTTARTAAAWSAMRAVFEGAAPDFALLAAISGRQPATIRRRANAGGWRPLDDNTDGLSRAERIARLANRLIGEMEAIEKDGKGGVYDKADILRRIDERIVELARFFAAEIVAGRADPEPGGAG